MKAKTFFKCSVLVIGVIVLPLLYSYFYLGAFWDPYNSLDKVPVAVVNQDKGATINGKDRNLGTEVVNELKKDGSLKFEVTNSADAQSGVEAKKYYAVITLPQDFSKNISTASTNDKKVAEIKYEVNQKHNYIASQILKNAINQIEAKTCGSVDQEIVSTLADKLNQIPDQLTTLNNGLGELKDGTSVLQTGAAKVANGQKALGNGIVRLSSGVDELYVGGSKLNSGIQTLDSGISQTLSGGQTLLSQFSPSGSTDPSKQTLYDGVSRINGGLTQIYGQFSASGSTDPSKQTIYDGVSAIKDGTDQASTGVSSYTMLVDNSIYTMIKTDPDASQKALAVYQGQLKAVQAAYDKATDLKTKINYYKQLQVLANLVTTYTVGLNAPDEATFETQLNALAKQDNTKQSVVSYGTALTSGAQQLSDGAQQLSAQFEDGGTFKSGVQQLLTGSQQLSGQFRADGALKSGVQQLVNALVQLKSGSSQLVSGSQQLQSGLATLKDGTPQLVSGSNQLVDASNQISDGASKLNSGVTTAQSKVQDSISDANSQLSQVKGLDTYAKKPVSVNTSELNKISNYGTAFAPYFMSLSLWVGALLMFFGIYLDADERIKVLSRHSTNKLVRVAAFAAIGVAQAVALALIVQFALGLSISNVPAYYLACIIISLVFISIIEFLVVNLKDLGKFLAVAFLVLQLTSNGGTFPMETVPKFFNVLYPLMPMTYAVNLFKEVTVNYNASVAGYNMFVLICIFAVFTGLTIVCSLTRKVKAKVKISQQLQVEE